VSRATIFLISTFLGVLFFVFGSSSVSSQQINYKYQFTASASLASILCSLGLLLILFLTPNKNKIYISENIVPLWRRIVAFFIDFTVILLIATPPAVLLVLIAEYRFTGNFLWQVKRDWSRNSDFLIIPIGFILVTLAFIIYLSLPPTKGRQTLGKYLLRYHFYSPNKSKITLIQSVSHTILGFFLSCIWIISVPVAFFSPKKYMLHDKATRIFPRLLEYKQTPKLPAN